MRKLLIIALICSMYCMSACKKGSSISPSLFGKWELRRTYGGGFVLYDSLYKAGNGNILQFNRDSTYKRFETNKLVSQGVFHIKHYNTGDYGIFFDNTTYGDTFSMKSTTMSIGTNVADGVVSDYQKISN